MSGCVFWPGCGHVYDDECGISELERQNEPDDPDEDDGEDYRSACGRWWGGKLSRSCQLAGTEQCDFDCSLRS